MKKIVSILILLLLISACQSVPEDIPTQLPPSPAPPSTEIQPSLIAFPADTEIPVDVATPVCASSEPTQDDIDRALSFTGKFFDTPDWQRTYTVTNESIQVTWSNASVPALAYLETYLFPCGYEELDLDAFFNVDTWQVIFGGYQSYRYKTECYTDSGERLYEFSAVDQDVEYNIRYWAVSDTDIRVIALMLVVPASMPEQLDDYSYALFPTLQSCE